MSSTLRAGRSYHSPGGGGGAEGAGPTTWGERGVDAHKLLPRLESWALEERRDCTREGSRVTELHWGPGQRC